MSRDHYRAAAEGWAFGATLVYGPIAQQLVARGDVSGADGRVLDVGAGTGVSEEPLRAAGATSVVGVDLSYDMLAWDRVNRSPAVVADVLQLPFAAAAFGAAVASFVLNHLTDPVAGMAELARVVRPGGVILATVYANTSRSKNRDIVDAVARSHGWLPPTWYEELKAQAIPMLGASAPMQTAAVSAGLVDVRVDEEDVDVGIIEPRALVDYRFGQAHFAEWRAALGSDEYAAARAAAIDAITLTMTPYRPRVVFLSARISRTGKDVGVVDARRPSVSPRGRDEKPGPLEQAELDREERNEAREEVLDELESDADIAEEDDGEESYDEKLELDRVEQDELGLTLDDPHQPEED